MESLKTLAGAIAVAAVVLAVAGPARAQDDGRTPADAADTPALDPERIDAQVDQAQASDRAIEQRVSGVAPLDPAEYEARARAIEEEDSRLDAARPTELNLGGDDHRAYQLHAEIDLPILLVGAVLAGQRLIERNSHPTCDGFDFEAWDMGGQMDSSLLRCNDEEDLFFIDRPFAGYYDETWGMVTDIGILALFGTWVALTTIDQGILNALNDAVVILEASLIASALSSMSVVSTGRARPFVYGTEAPDGARIGDNAAVSFFSGHTALAFAMATSIFWTFERIHPDRPLARWLVGGSLFAVASLVGIGRVLAGSHFPTDVMAGAAVGMGIGTLIPYLHDSPLQAHADVGADHAALNVTHQF